MRKFVVAAVVVAALLLAMLAMGMAQNDGCLPWQKSVGVEGSPFSGTEDIRRCRWGVDGAAPESNRPSRGLHDRTGFEGVDIGLFIAFTDRAEQLAEQLIRE